MVLDSKYNATNTAPPSQKERTAYQTVKRLACYLIQINAPHWKSIIIKNIVKKTNQKYHTKSIPLSLKHLERK